MEAGLVAVLALERQRQENRVGGQPEFYIQCQDHDPTQNSKCNFLYKY